MTPQTDALRLVLGLALGRDRIAHKVRAYLDGDNLALKQAPQLRARLDRAVEIINAGNPAATLAEAETILEARHAH